MNRQLPTEDEIFRIAFELPSPDARIAYLKQVCRDDVEVERLVGLLKEGSADASFLEKGPLQSDSNCLTEDLPAGVNLTGTMIGSYKLLQPIGEGGFGVVYMAEQTSPVRRKVALKVIKPGMDSKQVVARFEAERQALALMDHPNVARVYDGGSSDNGHPYFVMELVKGVPITQFSDENKLSIQDRLELFVTVCKAIQHAHHKGVIHRDIKPSNILVTLHDGSPVPKVIDFGVSKAISQQLTDKTMFTAHGQMIGTAQYMSPEQAEMSGLDIDTRSDIYSLGILLFELLTGSTPLDPRQIRQTGYAEMQRLIREQESPKPSTRLSTMGDQLTGIANKRSTDANRLSQFMRGDLDWIVMRSIEKERGRRYETASSFADDIERFLSDEPVEARPPSIRYKLQKFATRNRGPVIAGTTIAATLLLGAIGTTVGMLKAQQEARNSSNMAESRRVALETAEEERSNAIANQQAAEAAKRELETHSYFQQVRLADQALKDGRLTAALELLAECPHDLRKWEWHYLHRLACSAPPESLQIELPAVVRACVWSPVDEDLAVALIDDGSLFELTVTQNSTSSRFLGKVTPRKKKGVYGPRWELAISPAGDAVATLVQDGYAIIDLASGNIINKESGAFENLAFHPDRKQRRLAASDASGVLQVRDWQTGEVLSEKQLPEEIGEIQYSPDAESLIATNFHGGRTFVWATETGELRHTLKGHVGPIYSVAISSDSQFMATGGIDLNIVVWDLLSGEKHLDLRGHTDSITGLSFGPDRIVSADREGSMRLWRVSSDREILRTKPTASSLERPSFNSTGRRLLVKGEGGNMVKVWDATEGAKPSSPVVTFDNQWRVFDIAFLNNNTIASAGENGLRIWEVQTARKEPLHAFQGFCFKLAAHPDGNRVVCIDGSNPSGGGGFLFWDWRTGKTQRSRKCLPQPGRPLAISPNGNWLAAGSRNQPLSVWDLKHEINRNTRIDLGPKSAGYEVKFSPCSRYIAVVSDTKLRLWSTAFSPHSEGRTLARTDTGFSWHVAFSPDGEQLAFGDDQGDLTIAPTSENVDDESASITWKASEYPLVAVAYSPDGRFLATAGSDETIRFWDVTTQRLVHTVVDRSKTFCIAFSPDGRLFASGNHGRQVNVWNTEFLR